MPNVLDRTPRAFVLASVIVAYHVLLFLSVLLVGYLKGTPIRDLSQVLRFDALHYQWIAEHGYEGFRQAFFPLFPLIWRAIQMNIGSVVLLNGCIYVLVVYTLARNLRCDLRTVLVWCTLPNVVFFFVPYTESTFAIGATVLLLGTKQNKSWWVGLGILICTLARPAFTVLLPSALVVAWLVTKEPRLLLARVRPVLLGALLGLSAVLVIQYKDTHEWFGFFASQAGWGNHFVPPSLPLRSWGGLPVVMLDATALLFSFGCLFSIGHAFFRRLQGHPSETSAETLLSRCYVAAIGVLILFIHNGEIYSLNRFVFATPFFLFIAYRSLSEPFRWQSMKFVFGFGILTLYFLLFASFVHIQTFLSYFALSLFLSIAAHIASDRPRYQRPAVALYLIGAFCIQLYFTLRFLDGGWLA
jgi:hypothetical protein